MEWQWPEHEPPAQRTLSLGGVFSILTVKKLCLVQNRQAVDSKQKKTRQLDLLGNSDLADFN
jgi:hypothetical protein